MSIKKNFLFNSALTLAGYIFPLIIFPYVSRTLGVKNVGMCSFVDSIIDYYILFATLGVASLGIREIAKTQDDKRTRKQVFSTLLATHAISTLVVLLVLIISIYTVPQFQNYRQLLWIGASKLLFSLFLIEWLYQGLEKFKFITIRSIIVRSLFSIAVFLFVKNEEDYVVYYTLLAISVIVNSLFNIFYSRNFVQFSIRAICFNKFFKSFLIFGLNKLLISLYTSFNILFLGFVSNDMQVGYYSTAIKLYMIIIGLFTALTAVIIPKMSNYLKNNQIEDIKLLVNKTINILLIFALPTIVISEFFAHEIITLIAGDQYLGAILPFQIVMPLMIVIGLQQIFNQQLLMCLDHKKGIVITTLIGAVFGISLNVIFVPTFFSVGSSFAWVSSELSTLTLALFFVNKKIGILLPVKNIVKHIFYSTPYIIICMLSIILNSNNWYAFSLSTFLCIIYFLLLNLLINKNETVYNFYLNILSKAKLN